MCNVRIGNEPCERWEGGSAGVLPGRADAGFTFLELVVVMTILSLLFFFSLPSLDSYIFTDPSKKVARLIASTVRDLKQRALADHKEYRLHIATDAGEIWVADAAMDKKAAAEARKSGLTLPDDMSVDLPGFVGDDGKRSSEAMLRFYPKGYSDGAEILLMRDGRTLRLFIEPFLSKVEIVEDHANGF